MQHPTISIIAAMSAHDRGIGHAGALLWHIPADLRRFKQLTSDRPVIMGRSTYESIEQYVGGPLPGRTNIVVSRQPDRAARPGVRTARSLPSALTIAAAEDRTEVFIAGGGQVYADALPLADRCYLTLIEDQQPADTFFPPYAERFTRTVHEEHGTHDGLAYRFLTLEP